MQKGMVFCKMNKILENLKQELRNAEKINKVVKEEKERKRNPEHLWIEQEQERQEEYHPDMEDIVGISKHELGQI